MSSAALRWMAARRTIAAPQANALRALVPRVTSGVARATQSVVPRSLHTAVRCAQTPLEPATRAPAAVPTATPAVSTTPVSPVSSSSGGSNGGGGGESSWSTQLGVVLFLGTAVFTVYLGAWQVKRRTWKQELIDRRTAELALPPIDLLTYLHERHAAGGLAPAPSPSDAGAHSGGDLVAPEAELRRVVARGRFLYERTMLLGPRSPPSVDGSSTAGQGIGYFLVTPLVLENGTTILVNRGWCAKDLTRTARESKADQDIVEVVGVVRKGEARPQFLPESYDPLTGGSFIYLDLPLMARVSGVPPVPTLVAAPQAPGGPPAEAVVGEHVLMDALSVSNPGAARCMKRRLAREYVVFTTTPIIHAVYAGTWFTLSVALVALTYFRFKKKVAVPFGRPPPHKKLQK